MDFPGVAKIIRVQKSVYINKKVRLLGDHVGTLQMPCVGLECNLHSQAQG